MIIATGVICYMGLLSLSQAVPVAIAGAILGDWLWYFIGRKYARVLLKRFPSMLQKVEKLKHKVEEKGHILAFSGRFIFGGAVLFPVALGFYKYPFKKFALYEVIGTTLWAIIGISVGYILGQSSEYFFGEIKKIKHLVVVILVIAAAFWLLKKKYLNNKD